MAGQVLIDKKRLHSWFECKGEKTCFTVHFYVLYINRKSEMTLMQSHHTV